jgi:molecular chaperone GrpE
MSNEHEDPIRFVDRRRWAHGERAEGAPDQPLQKPTYIEELEQKLAQREKEAEEYLAKYRQASKEFEDARARMRKELAKDAERSRREVLISLLEVVDNLERAIDAALRLRSGQARDERADNALLQGVELVRNQFLAKLDAFGVTRIPSEGTMFDPELHEAVSVVPAADPSQDGVVVGTVRHGYRIGDEVLRPALVAVAKAGATPLSAP